MRSAKCVATGCIACSELITDIWNAKLVVFLLKGEAWSTELYTIRAWCSQLRSENVKPNMILGVCLSPLTAQFAQTRLNHNL